MTEQDDPARDRLRQRSALEQKILTRMAPPAELEGWSVRPLRSEEVLRFRGMTFPAYQHLLDQGQAEGVVAVGDTDTAPIGLALVQPGEDDGTAELLSVFVANGYRRRGVALAMLREACERLVGEGYLRLVARYPRGRPSSEATEGLLERGGFGEGRTHLIVFRVSARVAEIPWLRMAVLPPSFEVFPWQELTAAERRSLEETPAPESPFSEPLRLELEVSFGVRYRGEVVGWALGHITTPGTIRYSFHIRPELRFRGPCLFAELVRRHHEGPLARRTPRVTFGVHPDNRNMLHFVHKRMREYIDEENEYVESHCELAGFRQTPA